MKFVLPPGATSPEVAEVFARVAGECLQRGLRAALVVAQDRPAMMQAELKAAVGVLDLSQCPRNFRLAVVAFRKETYEAYRYALLPLGNRELQGLFWDELNAMQWLSSQFRKSPRSAAPA